MLYLYLDTSDSCYVLCNPDNYQVGLWAQDLVDAIESYFDCEFDDSHTVFTNNHYTLIATYPYNTLADFQANHPELFI